VPGIAASRLQRFHEVLEADDRIRQTLEEGHRNAATAGLHDAPQLNGDGCEDCYRAGLAEHQQTGIDSADELLPAIEPRGLQHSADVLRNGFLDAREIQDALAQYCALNLLEVRISALFGRARCAGQDHSDEPVVEAILHADERGGHFHQRGLVGGNLTRDDLPEPFGFRLHVGAQLTEAEHAERVSDLPQQLHLRSELLRLAAASAHEDIEDILDLAEILADCSRHRLHELDAR